MATSLTSTSGAKRPQNQAPPRLGGALTLLCALVGCAGEPAADPVAADAAEQADVPNDAANDAANDASNGTFSLDDTDKAMLEALDALHIGVAKDAFWPGFPVTTRPVYLLRRTVKGSPKHAFLTHVAAGSMTGESYTHNGHTVWRTNAGLTQLGAEEQAYAYANVEGVVATFVGYSEATLDDAEHFIGPLAEASFVRMRELEDEWEAVQGCGIAKYPRNLELIELTLLEDLLLGEIVAANAVDLPARMTEFAALRTRRLKLDPYTARIDNDGEIIFGAPYFARLRVPVIVGVRSQKSVDAELKERLAISMTLALQELDQHLLWKRPIAAAAVLMDAARRLGLPITTGFKAGLSVHAQWTAANGNGNPADVDAVRARHDLKALKGRAVELMAL